MGLVGTLRELETWRVTLRTADSRIASVTVEAHNRREARVKARLKLFKILARTDYRIPNTEEKVTPIG